MDEDVGPVVELIQADQRRIDPEARVDPEGVRSRLVGLRSWSRRQLVVVPREPVSSAPEVVPVGWICVEDRAAGRSNVQWSVAGHVPHRTELIACLLAWAARSEEHTSELQSRGQIVCRLLPAKKNANTPN